MGQSVMRAWILFLFTSLLCIHQGWTYSLPYNEESLDIPEYSVDNGPEALAVKMGKKGDKKKKEKEREEEDGDEEAKDEEEDGKGGEEETKDEEEEGNNEEAEEESDEEED